MRMIRRPVGAIFVSIALLTIGGVVPGPVDAGTEKTEICHYDAVNDSYGLLSVSSAAVAAHLGHGDVLPGSQGLDASCAPATAVVLARAYTEVDGVAGFDPAGDVLITELLDANGDSMVSPGDVIATGQYPLDFDATAFGNFTITNHVIDTVTTASPAFISVESGGNLFLWGKNSTEEFYTEGDPFAGVLVRDGFSVGEVDYIFAAGVSPSGSDTIVPDLTRSAGANDDYVNIDIACC